MKIPNHKFQIPQKYRVNALELEFGAWVLEFST